MTPKQLKQALREDEELNIWKGKQAIMAKPPKITQISNANWSYIRNRLYLLNRQMQERIGYYENGRRPKANIHFHSQKRNRKGIKNLTHNKREGRECDYFLDLKDREENEFWEAESNINLEEFDKKVRDDYMAFHKRKMPYNAKTSSEAIVNLDNRYTSIESILNALDSLNIPMKPLHISIHRDEGRGKNPLTQEIEKNYHAHIVFANYDFNTHRTLQRTIHKNEFRNFSQKLAKALRMEYNKKYLGNGKKVASSPNPRHLNRYQLEHRTNNNALRAIDLLKEKELEDFKNSYQFKSMIENTQKKEKERNFVRNLVSKSSKQIEQDLIKDFQELQDLRVNNANLDKYCEIKGIWELESNLFNGFDSVYSIKPILNYAKNTPQDKLAQELAQAIDEKKELEAEYELKREQRRKEAEAKQREQEKQQAEAKAKNAEQERIKAQQEREAKERWEAKLKELKERQAIRKEIKPKDRGMDR